MGYMHIDNLYKAQDILEFRKCYVMEKIHGTSAHVSYTHKGKLKFFSGGAKHENFVKIFDQEALEDAMKENLNNHPNVERITVYGEAYGGKMQKMSETYGKILKFVAFEVRCDRIWLHVPDAHKVVRNLGLDFVDYHLISTNIDRLDDYLYADSIQAIKNGQGAGRMREGIVLRPPFEVTKNDGSRIIAKYKRSEFSERQREPKVFDPNKQKILKAAQDIANEWCTSMRLDHVLDQFENPNMKDTGKIIKAMIADIEREAKGEIVPSKEARKAIGKKTVELFEAKLKSSLVSPS